MYRRLAATLASLTLAFTALHAQMPAGPLVYEAPAIPSATEDWTTLSLAKSGLPVKAIGGVLLSKVEQPEYTRELLRMQWRSGDPIDLYVIRPRGVERPPVVLYLYNYTTDTDIFRGDDWCRQATRGGTAAVGFVSALAGQRFHAPRPMKQWFVSELQEALSTSTHDVQMVLNYLDTRGDMDLKHVGIFGQGSGGSVAILATAADPRIIALDTLNPWGDWPDWLKGSQQIPADERAAYLKPEFLQKVAHLDPAGYLPLLNVKALRIQQVMDDPYTPQAARDKIAAAASKPDQVIRYQDRAAQEKSERASGSFKWLQEALAVKFP